VNVFLENLNDVAIGSILFRDWKQVGSKENGNESMFDVSLDLAFSSIENIFSQSDLQPTD
jgi:hypothetical protein